MIFGSKDTFGLKCSESSKLGTENLISVTIYVAGLELGDEQEFFLAGIAIHSASIFLSHAGSREISLHQPRALYDSLYETTYGDDWKIGLNRNNRARYALHEVFDLSVGDLGWVVFLIDTPDSNSLLLVGKRDSGYLTSCQVERGQAETVLSQFLHWLDEIKKLSKTLH